MQCEQVFPSIDLESGLLNRAIFASFAACILVHSYRQFLELIISFYNVCPPFWTIKGESFLSFMGNVALRNCNDQHHTNRGANSTALAVDLPIFS